MHFIKQAGRNKEFQKLNRLEFSLQFSSFNFVLFSANFFLQIIQYSFEGFCCVGRRLNVKVESGKICFRINLRHALGPNENVHKILMKRLITQFMLQEGLIK